MRGRLVQKTNTDNDFKTGSLYIFDRESSPGYVKIGWTSRSVTNRLKSIEEQCGYVPHLVYRVDGVPFARRVETLTHYELIQEWREELKCKKCSGIHEEWFEVDIERARQVLLEWASFFVQFEPYDSLGRLKSRWTEVTRAMDGRGITVTVRNLMDAHYEIVPCGTIRLVRQPQIWQRYIN
jgi:T5orf172 domain